MEKSECPRSSYGGNVDQTLDPWFGQENYLAICLLLFALELVAASRNAWIATWATSPQSGTPDSQEPLLNIENQTVRERLRASIDGTQIRLRFTNEFGSSPALNRSSYCSDFDRCLECQREIDLALFRSSD
jgi:hypothetical protein